MLSLVPSGIPSAGRVTDTLNCAIRYSAPPGKGDREGQMGKGDQAAPWGAAMWVLASSPGS